MLIILSLLTFDSFAHGHSKDGIAPMHHSEYKNSSYWPKAPKVVVCKDQTIFDIYEVAYALSMWDVKIDSIEQRQYCNYNYEYGVIKIVDAKQINTEEYWGYTKFKYKEVLIEGKTYRAFTKAIIQLDRNVDNMTLLVHEIGHAFGYNHYNEKSDVMNADYDYSKSFTGNYPY
jgi:hypothetical protein